MIVDAHAHSGDFLGRDWNARKLVAIMDRYGIDRACISSESALINGDEDGNRKVYREFVVPYPTRFTGMCVAIPRRSALDEVKRCADWGFRGIKLHPWLHQCPVDSSYYHPVLQWANRQHRAVLVHTGGTLSVPDLRFAPLAMLGHVAETYPDLWLVVGHMGLDRWEEAPERLAKYPNVILDLTMSMPHPGRISRALDYVGSERIVFGTDMPLLDPAVGLGLIRASAVAQEGKRKILGENIMRLTRDTEASNRE